VDEIAAASGVAAATVQGVGSFFHLLADPEFARWADGALLVLEHAADSPPASGGAAALWRLVRGKRYGNTAVSFFRSTV